MKPPGTYKLSYRSRGSGSEEVGMRCLDLGRGQRIVDSLRLQILDGGPDQSLRLRQVFSTPREIYRLEIREPEVGYSRITLLDEDALEDLLETDAVRERVLAQHSD